MMKGITTALICLAVAGFTATGSAAAPSEIAGFMLGANINQYENQLNPQDAFPLNEMRYLSEIETSSVKGFRKGEIVYGTCDKPGRIVRIKLKYADPSKDFYDRLLQGFKKKFGAPDEWRGDAFHQFLAWKWSFKTATGESVSMILQHAAADDLDHPSGNVVKLTNWTWVDEEKRCYHKKASEPLTGQSKKTIAEGPIEFNYYIPN